MAVLTMTMTVFLIAHDSLDGFSIISFSYYLLDWRRKINRIMGKVSILIWKGIWQVFIFIFWKFGVHSRKWIPRLNLRMKLNFSVFCLLRFLDLLLCNENVLLRDSNLIIFVKKMCFSQTTTFKLLILKYILVYLGRYQTSIMDLSLRKPLRNFGLSTSI